MTDDEQDGKRPELTFELRLVFDGSAQDSLAVKEEVKNWLAANGVESYVEGAVDSIDIEHDYENPELDRYESLGGDLSPISIYKYDREWLARLAVKLREEFSGRFILDIHDHDTRQWTEGWKDSFRPFATDLFYVRPPWERASDDSSRHELIIDPGMAFGTGQHATTQLCLRATEQLQKSGDLNVTSLLDVGTGSGILAVAAKKLGIDNVYATDIDPDSVISARQNAEANNVQYEVLRASVISGPEDGWDFIYANILSVVLKKIMSDLYENARVEATVVMSGIIAEEENEMVTLVERQGFIVHDTLRLDGWICLVLKK